MGELLALAAVLNLYAIAGLGYSNAYYAAAVKNMLTSRFTFFFVAYDVGFVAVWIENLDTRVEIASTPAKDVKGLLRVRAERMHQTLFERRPKAPAL